MRRSLFFVAVLAILAIPAVSLAGPPRPGPYVSGFVGVSIPKDTDVTFNQFSPTAASFNDKAKFDPSIDIGGTGGYDFGYVRLEGELSYKQGDFSSLTSTNVATGAVTQLSSMDGSLGAFGMMFNCFVDLHNYSPVTPYFGGGIGFAALHIDNTFGTVTSGQFAGTRVQAYWDDNDTVFAYQAGAGVSIDLNRQLALDVGYRYFGTSEANFNSNFNTETKLKFESHNVAVGVRVKFR